MPVCAAKNNNPTLFLAILQPSDGSSLYAAGNRSQNAVYI